MQKLCKSALNSLRIHSLESKRERVKSPRTKELQPCKFPPKPRADFSMSCSTTNCCFWSIKAEISFHLPPIYLGAIGQGIQKEINQRYLFRYSDSFQGVPICYNPKTLDYSKEPSEVIFENPFIHVQASVEFLVFSPLNGSTMTCKVNKQSEDHVGGLIYGAFNVSISGHSMKRAGYEWNEGNSSWEYCADENASSSTLRVQIGDDLPFRLKGITHGHGVMVLQGLSVYDEQ